MTAGIRFEDRLPLVIGLRKLEQAEIAPSVVLGRKHRVRNAFHPAVLLRAAEEAEGFSGGEHDARRGVPLRTNIADHEVMALGHAGAPQGIDALRLGPTA